MHRNFSPLQMNFGTCFLLISLSSFFIAASLFISSFCRLLAASLAASTALLCLCRSLCLCFISSASSMYLATNCCCCSSVSSVFFNRFCTTLPSIVTWIYQICITEISYKTNYTANQGQQSKLFAYQYCFFCY